MILGCSWFFGFGGGLFGGGPSCKDADIDSALASLLFCTSYSEIYGLGLCFGLGVEGLRLMIWVDSVQSVGFGAQLFFWVWGSGRVQTQSPYVQSKTATFTMIMSPAVTIQGVQEGPSDESPFKPGLTTKPPNLQQSILDWRAVLNPQP